MNKFKVVFTVLFLHLLSIGVYKAQTLISQSNKLLFKADRAFDLGDYLTALTLYKQYYPVDSTDNQLNYRMGICCSLLKTYKNDSRKYFEKAPYEKFPETDYYIGLSNHLSREYDAALFHFNRYKKNRQRDHSTKEVDDLIDKCNAAMFFESTADSKILVSNMGDSINTEYDEYAPLIPADENFMIFTSRRKNSIWQKKDFLGEYFEDIYIAKKDSNGWHVPEMLDTTFNTDVHDAGTGLSADGQKLLVYRTSENFKSGDIYESFYENGRWSRLTKLGENVNSPENVESSACYSSDGEIIFFSSDRPGGYGGKDIYMAKRLPNGNWAKPYNLGPAINTEYNEDAPFAHSLGNALYFSSQGHRNMGGYDIFRAEFDETGKFSEPKNVGYPLNTVDDDIFFALNPDGSKGYLSSGRDGGYGGQDIYSVSFVPASAPLDVYNLYVLDESNNIIKDVVMDIVDIKTKTLYGNYKSNEHTGKILFISESKKEYQVTIKSKGYEIFVTNVVFFDFNRDKFFTLKKNN